MNPGEFYALPQSPQQYKQLLMVAGMDRYFQIVRCFRDEDLRADRQPEFTQIDCEMSFVEQEDVLNTFEGLARHLFKEMKGLEFDQFPRMTWHDAMKYYGSDKPDIRFGMKFVELNDVVKGKGFGLFDNADLVVGICAEGCSEYTRKQLDALTEFVKRPQVGAGGMVYIKYNTDGTFKSSVDKFYTPEDLKVIADKFGAKPGDLMLILCGEAMKTRTQLNALRLEMGNQLGLRKPDEYAPLWVIDFPLLEWDEETQRYYAMHHPFTAPKPDEVGRHPRQRLRHRDEWCGGGWRLHPYPRPHFAEQDVPHPRLHRREGAGAVRLPDGCLRVWRTASRWSGLWFRPSLLALWRR